VPWAVAFGLLGTGISMCLVGRPGAASDRPDFYGSYDGKAFLLSPFVALPGLLLLAVLCVRAARHRWNDGMREETSPLPQPTTWPDGWYPLDAPTAALFERELRNELR
jgi:hypothetical protein